MKSKTVVEKFKVQQFSVSTILDILFTSKTDKKKLLTFVGANIFIDYFVFSQNRAMLKHLNQY